MASLPRVRFSSRQLPTQDLLCYSTAKGPRLVVLRLPDASVMPLPLGLFENAADRCQRGDVWLLAQCLGEHWCVPLPLGSAKKRRIGRSFDCEVSADHGHVWTTRSEGGPFELVNPLSGESTGAAEGTAGLRLEAVLDVGLVCRHPRDSVGVHAHELQLVKLDGSPSVDIGRGAQVANNSEVFVFSDFDRRTDARAFLHIFRADAPMVSVPAPDEFEWSWTGSLDVAGERLAIGLDTRIDLLFDANGNEPPAPNDRQPIHHLAIVDTRSGTFDIVVADLSDGVGQPVWFGHDEWLAWDTYRSVLLAHLPSSELVRVKASVAPLLPLRADDLNNL